jgi:hypothetical protein
MARRGREKRQSNWHVIDSDRRTSSKTVIFDGHSDPRDEQGGVENCHHEHVVRCILAARPQESIADSHERAKQRGDSD